MSFLELPLTSLTVATFVTSSVGDWVIVVSVQSLVVLPSPSSPSSALSSTAAFVEITLASISRQLFNCPLSIAAWSKVYFPW